MLLLAMFSLMIRSNGFYRAPTYRVSDSVSFALFLPPHLNYGVQRIVARQLLRFKVVESFAHNLLHIGISPFTQQLLDRGDKFSIKVLCKEVGRIVGQDSREHNGIVLCKPSGIVFFGEVASNGQSGLLGCDRTGFGGVDDRR